MNPHDLIQKITETAAHYTPEWIPNPEKPDSGMAFALTFAEMFGETTAKFNRLFEKHHIEFLNAVGIDMTKKKAAEGMVCFSLAHGAPQGCLVETDTPVYSEDGLVFTTTRSVYVTNALLHDLYYRMGDSFYNVENHTEGFTLFEKGTNLQCHALYIGHPWLFAHSDGMKISLCLQGEHTALLGDCHAVQWQYFTGEWTNFTEASYEDDRLTLSAALPFLKTTLQQQSLFFIRCLALTNKIEPVTLQGLSVKAWSCEPLPLKMFQNDLEISDDVFYPFGQTLSSYASFYIACSSAFSKKGALVTIRFHVLLFHQEIENPMPEIPVQWRRVVSKRELEPPPVYDATIDQIVLEYWNGEDFVRLPTLYPVKGLFATDGMSKTICFVCPEDVRTVTMFGFAGKWIRFRILRIVNEHKMNTRHVTPLISELSVSYAYENDLPVSCVIAQNNGETQYDLPFKPFSFYPANEYAVYFGFDKPFGGSPIGMLWDVTPNEMKHELQWYVYSRNEWKSIDVVGNFWQTGYTRHAVQEAMEPCSCFGKTRYWLLAKIWEKPTEPLRVRGLYLGGVPVVQKTEEQQAFISITLQDTEKLWPMPTEKCCDLTVQVDECDDLEQQHFVTWHEKDADSYQVLPQGIWFDSAALRRMHKHKVKPVIQIFYRLTEGEKGNFSRITQIGRALGYVSAVTNPLPITGGRGLESVDRMIARSGAKMIDRNRAVTAQAYESLAMEASVDVVKCKCFPATDENGSKQTGAVTVIYLPKDMDLHKKCARELYRYLLDRSPPQVKLFVREAIYVELSITVQITIKNRFIIKAREKFEKALAAFLNPVNGNFNQKGFSIGEIPDSGCLMSLFYSFDEVALVDALGITYTSVSHAIRREMDIQAFANIHFCTILNGEHQIKVVANDTKLESG